MLFSTLKADGILTNYSDFWPENIAFFVWTKRGMHDKTSRNIAYKDGNDTLHLVAHPVDLLDVREDHLGVDPVVPDHGVHVVGSEEVRNAGVPPVG